MPRHFLAVAVVVALAGSGSGLGAAAARPNVLLILSDDHSVPHLGCYGDPDIRARNLTPNLDTFAGAGVVFERAYTTAPQCAPSRISIFTGRNPVDLGVTRFAQPARPDVPFFSDILRQHGYWVGIDGRNHHLDGRGREPAHIEQALTEAGLKDLAPRFDQLERTGTRGAAIDTLEQRVGATLDAIGSRPFFLYFGFNQPHRGFGGAHSDIDRSTLKLPPDWPDLPEVRDDYARFLGDVRELDRGFGKIMAVLEQRALTENTLVIFMGDNGESMYRGKGTLYTRGLNVPLIVRWPAKVAGGRRSRQLVSGVDLAPTILAAAGLEPPKPMEGISFLPELLGESYAGRKYAFAERGWHFGPITESEGLDFGRSVTSTRYHFIYNAQPLQPYSPVDQGGRYARQSRGDPPEVLRAGYLPPDKRGTPAWRAVRQAHAEGKLPPLLARIYFERPRPIFELYDLEEDPFQLTNLAGKPEWSTVERELREQLDGWMVRSFDFLPLPTHAYQETPEPRR